MLGVYWRVDFNECNEIDDASHGEQNSGLDFYYFDCNMDCNIHI